MNEDGHAATVSLSWQHFDWLRLTAEHDVGSKLHHRDIIGLALQRLESEFDSAQRQEILAAVEKLVQKHE